MAFLIDVLATWRIVRLVVHDDLTAPLRLWCKYEAPRRWRWFLGSVVECEWCCAVWIALGVTLARRVAPRAWSHLAYPLAVSGVAAAIAVQLEDAPTEH